MRISLLHTTAILFYSATFVFFSAFVVYVVTDLELSYPHVLIMVMLVWGVSMTFWSIVGIARLMEEYVYSQIHTMFQVTTASVSLSVNDVAVVVPAHNEELVITDTIESLLKLVPPQNIFVVSDGSRDKTVSKVKSLGVQVLELVQSRGKAGALKACILHFKLRYMYKIITFVDADTRLKSDYFEKGLLFFRNPRVVAVAGYAQTIWNPENLSWRQKLFILHRDRVYFLSQRLIKFGQTWRYVSATHIIPGFASMYRSSVLGSIDMNPPGLVIEDFNMTFEVHHKSLGLIAHHPSVVAYTQDPDNWNDYFRQIKRWHLGLWQTVRLHKFWPSFFSVSLGFTLFETVLGSFIFLYAPLVLLVGLLPGLLVAMPTVEASSLGSLLREFSVPPTLFLSLLFAVWVADYSLSVITAISQRRPQYLLYGVAFPFLRILDAVAFLGAIPKAFSVQSNGRWLSPTRRAS